MKLAISNIALPSFSHAGELKELAQIGFTGLEVAPSKVWQNVLTTSEAKAQAYRRTVEDAGLHIIGFHSLFFDQPDLGLFRAPKTTEATLDFMEHLSALCAALGGRTLVFGSGGARQRRNLAIEDADAQTVDFFSKLSARIAGHGTCVVIEALSNEFADYISTLAHAQRIIEEVGRPELRSHIDLAAATAANELDMASFQTVSGSLAHVHINEPGLKKLESTGGTNHTKAATLLRGINYTGYCSLEQRMAATGNIMAPIRTSMQMLKENYG